MLKEFRTRDTKSVTVANLGDSWVWVDLQSEHLQCTHPLIDMQAVHLYLALLVRRHTADLYERLHHVNLTVLVRRMHLNLDEPSPHALPLDACLVLWLWVSAATLSEETLLVQMVETTDGFESVLGQITDISDLLTAVLVPQ